MKKAIYFLLIIICFTSCKTFVTNTPSSRVPVTLDTTQKLSVKEPVNVKVLNQPEIKCNCQKTIPFIHYLVNGGSIDVTGPGFITGLVGAISIEYDGKSTMITSNQDGTGYSATMIALPAGKNTIRWLNGGMASIFGYKLE